MKSLQLSVVALVLTAHSGWIRFHEYNGHQAFQQLQIPDELALARSTPDPWLSPADRAVATTGRDHLGTAARFGLLASGETVSKLAWFEYLLGQPERSAELLSNAANLQKKQARALSLYYRGTILNRLGRYPEAKESLDAALAERDDLILARQERGESLWLLGAREEAVATWSDAFRRNSQLPLVGNFLAGAYRAAGQMDAAAPFEQQADRATPDVPAFHWMLGQRLTNVGMRDMAEKHYQRSIQLDPSFQYRPR